MTGTDEDTERTAMYFDGTTLTTLLSDADKAAANAAAIAAAGPRYTSPLEVIEAIVEQPDLGEAGVTAFLDAHCIELRDMPPRHHLVPQANPIGLTQTETSFLMGRLDSSTGENFNRNYPDLSELGSLALGPDVVVLLEIQPISIRLAEHLAQPQRSIRGDRTLALHDLVHATWRHVEQSSQLALGQAEVDQVLIGKDPSGVNGRDASAGHVWSLSSDSRRSRLPIVDADAVFALPIPGPGTTTLPGYATAN